jgi:hypothetical protein
MNALETYIKSSVSLSPNDLQTITSSFKPGSINKGEYFGKKGRFCDKLSFVQTGYLRMFVEADDREVDLRPGIFYH